MLTVHHLNNSRSQRVLWLLEELGVSYEIARYQRQSNMLAPPELRAVHPLGKSPVITDGEQRKYHNFWTYSVHGLPNTAADGFPIPFSAGSSRKTATAT